MISIDTQGIHFLALVLHWYAILVVGAAWAGVEVAARLAKRVGQQPEDAWQALVWVLIGGLIGARAWFVLFPPTSYVDNGLTAGWMLSHFLDLNQGAIALWAGGLGFLGAIIGGTVSLYAFTRSRKLPFGLWADLGAVALPLAQAIGYLVSSPAIYGPPTSLPWGILIDDKALRVGAYTDLNRYPLATTLFQPVALYELMLAVVIFVVLFGAFTRFRGLFRQGDIALLYISLYGIGRLMLELIRANVSLVWSVNVSQATAGVAALIAIGLLVRRVGIPSRSAHPD
jgi:phosphatidylglycerol:prolipoprotein diacylglycerol transferase